MNSTPEALPMPPPSLPQVMSSPAVHPAEIAAEKDNAEVEPVEESTPEVQQESTPEVEQVEVAPENNVNTYIFEVCNNISAFMKTNDEKLITLNNVVEQLTSLGLSDNSAIESLNNQRVKYMEVLDKIHKSFEDIYCITNFIL